MLVQVTYIRKFIMADSEDELKVPNHFVLPIANPFLLCPDV